MITARTRRYTRLFVAAVAATAATAAAAVPALAAEPPTRVTVSTDLAWPGRPLTVAGTGFRSGPVQLLLDAQTLLTVRADSSGAFRQQVMLPRTTKPGQHQLRAQQPKRAAVTALRSRVQWTQQGMFPARQNNAFFERGVTPQTALDVKTAYRGTTGLNATGALVVAQGLVIAPIDGGATAVEASTGRTVWDYRSGEEASEWGIAYDPARGVVYLTNYESQLTTLDAATGKLLRLDNTLELLQAGIRPGLALNNGLLFIPTVRETDTGHIGEVVALDTATWTPRWRVQGAQWALRGGLLYTADASLRAFDAVTGERRWSVPVDAAQPDKIGGIDMAVSDRGVVLIVNDATVRSYDPATGRAQWTTPPLRHERGYTPEGLTIGGGRVYVDVIERTYALDEVTGATIWRVESGGGPSIYANGVLIGGVGALANGTELATADAATGQFLDSVPVRSTIGNIKALVDGILYTSDQGISAFVLGPS